MKKADEPAFPFSEGIEPLNEHRRGLTKREYFASNILQGLIASHANPGASSPAHRINEIVSEAMLLTDVLLKQIEK